MNLDDCFAKFIKSKLYQEYVSHRFEMISRQALIRLNKEGLVKPPLTRIGKYFYDDKNKHRNGEFDVATKDENGYVLYECKWLSRKLDTKDIKNEEKQPL